MPAEDAAVADESARADSGIRVPMGWLAFCALMLGAAAVDLLVISRPEAKLPPRIAARLGSAPTFARQIVFWLCIGVLFNILIWGLLGRAAAGAWLYGYILEYVLSIDNLFVFQAIFRSYSTPSTQVDRALFWGISAAIVLRLAFFGVGTELLSMGFVARCAFGLALIYSGVKTLRSSDEEDDEDPTKNPLVRCVSRLLPVHDSYVDGAAFFVRAPAPKGGRPLPVTLGRVDDAVGAKLPEEGDYEAKVGAELECEEGASKAKGYAVLDRKDLDHGPLARSRSAPPPEDRAAESSGAVALECEDGHAQGSVAGKGSLRVTPLFLVVVTLGVIDVIFAVDSVTAKISSISGMGDGVSLLLNLSSSAFAMFVVRSLYAVVGMLSRMFRFLGCGVGVVLVLIGVKLILSGHVELGMRTSCAAILAILLVSILASIALPEPGREPERSVEKIPAEESDKVAYVARPCPEEQRAREEVFA